MVQLKGQHRKGIGQVRGLSMVKLSPLYLSCICHSKINMGQMTAPKKGDADMCCNSIIMSMQLCMETIEGYIKHYPDQLQMHQTCHMASSSCL